MAWGIEQSIRLISLFLFVFWEWSTTSDAGRHYKYAAKHYNIPIYIKGRWFAVIWLFIKSCVVASSFLYMEYTVSTAADWPYTAFFVLFFVNIIMSKLWMPLFFDMHMYTAALVNAILLAGTAWTIFVIAIIGVNLRAEVYLAPALVWLPYALWLSVAVLLNWQWASAKMYHLRKGHVPYGYSGPMRSK